MTVKQIYLDHNATTPVRDEVVKAMLPYYTEFFGNASGVYTHGLEAKQALEASRETIASFLGAKPNEIIFTSCGTESDNLAIKGFVSANPDKGNHIITSVVEHPAVLNTCRYLETQGFKVTYLPVDEHGLVNPKDVKNAITKETSLISIMFANNEVGTIQPIEEIGNIAKENNITFHTDAVQAIGKVPVNVDKLNLDMLSLSGHKIYAPKGIGVLYRREGTKLQPQMHGGHHEGNLRAGTENVASIVGLSKAVEIAGLEMEAENKRLLNLRDKLWDGLNSKIDRIRLNGHPVKRLPNTLDVIFEYIESEAIILNLDFKGISVSGGSACSSDKAEPSHVLTAMGIDPACAQGAIRFSLGKDNTQEDIDYVINILPEIVAKLRKISPLYPVKS